MISHLALHFFAKALRGLAKEAPIRAFALRTAGAAFMGVLLGFGFSASVLFGFVFSVLWEQQARAKRPTAAGERNETAPPQPPAAPRLTVRPPTPVAPNPGVVMASPFNESPRQRARRLAAEEKLSRARKPLAGDAASIGRNLIAT